MYYSRMNPILHFLFHMASNNSQKEVKYFIYNVTLRLLYKLLKQHHLSKNLVAGPKNLYKTIFKITWY